MNKEDWIERVHQLLCASHEPKDNDERSNLFGYARLMASEESAYFQEGLSPEEAYEEEMSCS